MVESSLAPLPAAPWLHALRVCGRLIWNDCKQGLRKHLSGNTTRDKVLRASGALFGFLFMAGLHFGAFALVSYTWLSPSADKPGLMAGLSTAIWSFLLFVMLSGGLVRALVVLHEQDDSSLLLSSPVSPRAILAGRLFGNALQSCLVDGFIIIPYINIRIVTFAAPHYVNLNFLWGYAVWFALAVIVTCLDGLFSFGLIRWLGMKRARFLAQAVPFLLIFGVTLLAGTLSVSVSEMSTDEDHMPPEMQAKFLQLAHTPMSVLAYAAAGDPVYLVGIFGSAVALALLTLRLTERAFIEGTQHIAENETPAAPARADLPFQSSLLYLEVRKNLRLIVRTPMMTVQCLAQALMPIGIACVLGRDDVGRAVAFFVIFAAGVLSGMFTIAAGTVEECEDLLAMAPRQLRLFRYGKMLSGSIYPLGVTLAVGLGLLVSGEGSYAIAVLLGGIPLGLAASVCGETFATAVKPGVKPKLLADPIMMIPLLGMQIISGAVAGGCVFAASYSDEMLTLSLLLTYLVLLMAIGLAQLRKPLF
jgi:ABC-2 type transport system permease protein